MMYLTEVASWTPDDDDDVFVDRFRLTGYCPINVYHQHGPFTHISIELTEEERAKFDGFVRAYYAKEGR